MLFRVTFLVLLAYRPCEIDSQRVCVPNTYITLNGRTCLCDLHGRFTEANCKNTARKSCRTGQIIWQGCNQCICQGNGQLLCTSAYCSNRATKPGISYHNIAEFGPKCTPFRSYYVNCSLCFCPASGQVTEAQCATDASCSLDQTSDITAITKRNQCIPNVMYLFPCVQCLCSEFGYFILDKCLEKCQSQIKYRRRCIPGTLYRSDCDVCRCPDSSIPDEKLCIKGHCNTRSKQQYLHSLRSTSGDHCVPRTFTKPKCIYCDCSSDGIVDEHSCLELDCSKVPEFKYYAQTDVCSPGELVPICMECFCLNNELTNESYCTRVCTYQSKLSILEKVLNDSRVDETLIDKTKIKTVGRSETCEPDTLYLDRGKYCLCSDNGNSNLKFCTAVIEDLKHKSVDDNKIIFDVTKSCVPNTLVDFDCNTCYCSKMGKIDPKWCTYDDCEAKRIVMESHKSHSDPEPLEDPDGVCTPGSLSKVKCNFCICPESGILRDRACTKNECIENTEKTNEKFTCEPLAYYEVDCNICICPRDGLKNVAKCTKNQCDKNFLRSEACISSQLFSDECNVCICPSNGNKAHRVCTNHTCNVSRWKNFKLADSLIENEVHDDGTRNLDLCFPGEEFSMGCNLCVCSELGLKVYASCERVLCDENVESVIRSTDVNLNNMPNLKGKTTKLLSGAIHSRVRRDVNDKCFIYKISDSAERHDCTPGSMYILRCQQCICPYMGSINSFCRPLPKSFYCEQAFPGFNYLSSGRREIKNSTTEENIKTGTTKDSVTVSVTHLNHTTYECDRPGRIMDECFICECEKNFVIEEHCFKSNVEKCSNAKPTFFNRNKLIIS